ncbi:MAG: hypothetical protein AABX33_00480 [Nanoarchaeota archaeon]
MDKSDLAKFVDSEGERKKESGKKSSFFELLDLLDFRDDLRYK